MVDLEVLKQRGITEESLKTLFTSDKPSEKLQAFKNRLNSRINDGLTYNFTHWKVNYAVDQAWDTPLRQISPTLVRALAAKTPNITEANDELMKVAKDMGLTHMLSDTLDPKTGKPLPRKKLDIPALFEIVFPIMRAYVIIRAAKIVNDRNLVPFFKYEPSKSTQMNRRRCEVITDRVDEISTTFGYYEYLKQSTLKCLLYSHQIMFPQEEWFSEKQLQTQKDGKIKEVYTREGIRYHVPHPNRTYCDMAHPMSSINTDTGCQFYGYWRVVRFKDIRTNSKFYNTDRVGIGSDWKNQYPNYFTYAYSSCTLAFPGDGMGGSPTDRETKWYASDQDDQGVLLTEHFECCNPKADGLGDYDYPVWFRFVVASDNSVMYAAPLPSHPGIFFGGDNDEGRVLNGSQALEILPFQDQISNLLTQALLAAKNNLANVTFVNTDVVDASILDKIENWGEKLWRKLNFATASFKKLKDKQADVNEAFASVKFPQMDVGTLLTLINQMLNLLERVMQTSAQEVGSYASHEQSAEEIRNISQSTSQRIKFTSTPIDIGIYWWKVQLYNYLMAYGEQEFYAQIPASPPITDEELEELGFTVEEHAESEAGKHLVKAKKSSIRIESFASTRDAENRVNSAAVATAMSQFIGQIITNEPMMMAIGAEQAVHLMNQILETLGLPRDFKLRYVGTPGGMTTEDFLKKQMLEFAGQVKQLVEQTAQQSGKETDEKLATAIKPIVDAIAKTQFQVEETQKAVDDLTKIMTEMHGYDPNAEISTGGPGTNLDPGMAGAVPMQPSAPVI